MTDGSFWDYATKFSFVLTALVTVIGWFIVASQTERREFRKEVREHIKSCQDRAQKVRESSSNYWLKADTKLAPSAAAELKADLMALARQISVLSSSGLSLSPELMAEIRTAATGGEFEKRGRRRHSRDIERVADVAHATEDLLQTIDVEFYRRFPPYERKKRYLWLAALFPFMVSSDLPT